MINIKTKQWGNSLGVIIPKEVVHELNLSVGDELSVDIVKKVNVLKELWGALDWGKDKGKILQEVRKDLEGKWL
jgi:bifunctional DNA-binding transcriptional regulator/antitoxin component of YhaV-PrlF toxin-antitoxin module